MQREQLLIEGALRQAGEPSALPPDVNALELLRITPETPLAPMDFLLRLFGRPCFPRGELVAITGKAKSGKTFLTSMLMASGVAGDVLGFHRGREDPLRVLWYDTEQSDESTQDILRNRLVPMTGGRAGLPDVFNVRSLGWQERRRLLPVAVEHCVPDLVIVDGIRDLVNDINDGVLAQEVMEELMALAAARQCCIVCILHQNKGSEDHNLRGWIGTELMNKAFEVYACEKLLPDRIFQVSQTMTRKYDIEPALYFRVGPDGLPVGCQGPQAVPAKDSEQLPPLNRQYIVSQDGGQWEFDLRRLFTDALQGEDEVQARIFRQRVMDLSGITLYMTYNNLLCKALEQKVIEKVNRGRVTFYRAAPF